MKHCMYPCGLEFTEHPAAVDLWRQQNVIDMAVVVTIRRHDGATQQALMLERRQHLVIGAPQRDASCRDALRFFQLRPQEGGGGIAWQQR